MTYRKLRARGVLKAGAAVAVSVLASVTAASGAFAATSPGAPLYGESFKGTAATPGDWITGGKGFQPCLTAGNPNAVSSIPACGLRTPDKPGQGVLRLTSNGKGESGYVLYTRPLMASKGLDITFSEYQYHKTTPQGADGIAFFLINGADKPARAGVGGGYLGYKYLTGAYLGLGFDEYGNFADRRLWGTGTKGRFPNSIVARGAASVKYKYLDGKRASGELGVGTATKRADAKRTVEIRLSNVGVLTVDVNYGKGQVRELNHVQLYLVKGQPKLPKTIKFGFAASTGAYTNIHEISGLRIAVLPPELQTTITPGSRELKAGGTATFTATVGATWMSAPVTGQVTETITFPAGVTPTGASGTGWTCAISGQVVNCVTTAHRSALQNYPPITIAGKVLVTAAPKVTVTAAAHTDGMNVWSGDIATTTVPTSGSKPAPIVGPSPATKRPDLSVKITPEGPFPAPGTGKYLLVVANAPGAGTATGLLREQFTAPHGQLPVSASGPGWTCVISGQTVTCTRPGPLAGGETAPSVTIVVRTFAHTQPAPAIVLVSAPGDSGQPAETALATAQLLPVSPPATTPPGSSSSTSSTSSTSGSSSTSSTSGTSGATGTSGTSGTVGTSGTSGITGASGTSGTSGASGTIGTSGTMGTSSTSGTGTSPCHCMKTTSGYHYWYVLVPVEPCPLAHTE